MGELRGHQRRVLKQARLRWDERVKDPRGAWGTRHEHLGLLGLVVAAFAVGKKGLKQAAQLAGDVGVRTRKRLELPRSVVGSTLWRLLEKQQPDGLRETLRAQAQSVLEDPNTPLLGFPWGVIYSRKRAFITGSSDLTIREWVSVQPYAAQRDFGLLAIENIKAGIWR